MDQLFITHKRQGTVFSISRAARRREAALLLPVRRAAPAEGSGRPSRRCPPQAAEGEKANRAPSCRGQGQGRGRLRHPRTGRKALAGPPIGRRAGAAQCARPAFVHRELN